MNMEEALQKNWDLYQTMGKHYLKSWQSLMETNVEQSKAVQAQTLDMVNTMLDGQVDVAVSGLKSYEVEMSNWTKLWQDFVTAQMPKNQD